MRIKQGEPIIDVLIKADMAATRADARRLIMQRAVRLNDECVTQAGEKISQTCVLRVGNTRIEPLVLE